MAEADLKDRVRAYWDAEPNASRHSSAPEGTREFYDEIERRRYELEPFVPRYADFDGAAGKTLLEIGIGIGTDFIRFARAGARATGVDLTEHAVALVRRRLELEGLDAQVRKADAEALPFADGSFERVYSWGVLHHTPDTQRSIDEAIRVLAPGGSLTVMLYHRHSWVAYGLWLRRALFRFRPWLSLSRVLAEHMESVGTKAYTIAEARLLFAALDNVRVDSVATPYDRQMVGPVAKIAARRLGWFLVIRGQRAAA
jgi:SAM-dependent methyltransferase